MGSWVALCFPPILCEAEYLGILISNELKYNFELYNSTPPLKWTHHMQYAYMYVLVLSIHKYI